MAIVIGAIITTIAVILLAIGTGWLMKEIMKDEDKI